MKRELLKAKLTCCLATIFLSLFVIHCERSQNSDQGIVLKAFVQPRWTPYLKRAETKWNKTHLQNKIDLQILELGYPQLRSKLITAAGGNNAPDFSLIDIVWIAEFVEAGYLIPIDEFEKAWVDSVFRTDWFESLVNAVSYNNHIYGLVTQTGTEHLYYRRDWFKQEKIKPLETWNQLIDTTKYFQQILIVWFRKNNLSNYKKVEAIKNQMIKRLEDIVKKFRYRKLKRIFTFTFFGKKQMIVALGEILFDIFPGYKRIGGAPFNFAYHMLKMGIPVNFVTKIGEDDAGRNIMSYLDLNGFNTLHVQWDSRYETGRVIVKLDSEGNPKFNILEDAAYDFIEFDPGIAATLRQKPGLIYFGSLAQRTETGFKTIQRILSARESATRCFYDVNLRPHCYTEKIVKESLRQSDVVKMNEDELQCLKTIFRFLKSDRSFIEYLMQTYGIEMLSVTKGKKGSEVFTLANSYQIENDPMETVADTVGAGDAYASMIAVGYMNHWHPNCILEKATELARRVCTIKGAIPKEADFYKNLIDDEKEAV